MNYIKDITQKHPKRRNQHDKAEFAKYVVKQANEVGFTAEIETLDKKHNNIIIGDYKKATTIFTAHYDTPYQSLLPNLIIPKNKVIYFLYQFGCPILISLLCLLIALGISKVFALKIEVTAVIYLIIYLGLYYLLFRAFPNKNNVNDNTSGVATVLTILSKTKNKDVAFILFDNEELGKKGSKALCKKYSELFQNKLVINFDCVGNGNSILLIYSDAAYESKEFKLIEKTFTSSKEFEVVHCLRKNTENNSDNKSFPNSIGVLACKRGKRIKYYVPNIHTKKDTIAKDENIEFLANCAIKYINQDC